MQIHDIYTRTPNGKLNDDHPFCFLFLIGANEDYFSGPYYIVFTAGMTEAVFNISVNDNDILEETETFNIVINSLLLPNNVTIGELDEAVVTILDNDGEVYQTVIYSHHLVHIRGICICMHLELLTSVIYSNVIFSIRVVQYCVIYNRCGWVSVHVYIYDVLLRSNVWISSSTVVITVRFSQVQYNLAEGMDNDRSGVELWLSNPSSFEIMVFVMPDDITATGLNSSECLLASGESDYLYEVYTVTFPVSVTLQTVDVPICDDQVLEQDEMFSLFIDSNSHPNNVINRSPDHVNITIVDNDGKC